MRGRAAIVLLGLTALGAYLVEHQSGSMSFVPSALAGPVAFNGSSSAAPSASGGPPPPSAKAALSDNPAAPDTKGKVDTVLTAAAIAAIIVQASRDQYHATGRPCACPDDSARNGSACGGRSAYSRPGGAEPLCYPSDVSAAMIESYRRKLASH
jgi:hypothetical protein